MAIFCRQRVVVAVALKTGLPYIDRVTGRDAISVWLSIKYLLFQYRAQLSLQVTGFGKFLIKSVISNRFFIKGVKYGNKIKRTSCSGFINALSF